MVFYCCIYKYLQAVKICFIKLNKICDEMRFTFRLLSYYYLNKVFFKLFKLRPPKNYNEFPPMVAK